MSDTSTLVTDHPGNTAAETRAVVLSAEAELLPCPFCGGEAVSISPDEWGGGEWYVKCIRCEGKSGWFDTEDEVTSAWNLRLGAKIDCLKQCIDALERTLEACTPQHDLQLASAESLN